MLNEQKKVVLVGTGLVGMSYAYALLNQNACDELVLVDIDRKRAAGEAMDLNHGLAFSGSHMKIYAGTYEDCGDAGIVVISAGVAQKPGEGRIDLLTRNAAVFKSIIEPVINSGFSGIFLVATNPVDIMAHVTRHLSGFDRNRVIGTGTTLDTARLRYLLGNYFGVDPRNVHAYVMGEHGDSEFVPWSQAMIATKPVLQLIDESNGKYKYEDLVAISEDVKTAAYKIIEAKKASYYGIGMSLVRITKAIFGNESSVLTLSAMLNGEYGVKNVYTGVPSIVNRQGVERILQLGLTDEEKAQFAKSNQILKEVYSDLIKNNPIFCNRS
jgi:L-lactate dehydrogenase